jgi:hypothetical protein
VDNLEGVTPFLYICIQSLKNYWVLTERSCKPGFGTLSTQAKSAHPPVYVNKVLLEHNHTFLYILLYLFSCHNSRAKYFPQRPQHLQSIEYLLFDTSQKKLTSFCSRLFTTARNSGYNEPPFPEEWYWSILHPCLCSAVPNIKLHS